jgi:hypothetical protein
MGRPLDSSDPDEVFGPKPDSDMPVVATCKSEDYGVFLRKEGKGFFL